MESGGLAVGRKARTQPRPQIGAPSIADAVRRRNKTGGFGCVAKFCRKTGSSRAEGAAAVAQLAEHWFRDNSSCRRHGRRLAGGGGLAEPPETRPQGP